MNKETCVIWGLLACAVSSIVHYLVIFNTDCTEVYKAILITTGLLSLSWYLATLLIIANKD